MARPGLSRNRKYLRLVRTLGSETLARGSLELMWDCAYENGDEYLGDSDDVELAAKWTGEQGKLTEALLHAGGDDPGFIEEIQGHPGKYRVHDLWDHAPDYVRKRRTRELERQTKGAELASVSRRRPVTDQTLTGHCPPDGSHCPPTSDCQSEVGRTRAPAPAPAPAPAQDHASDEPPRPLLVLDRVDGTAERVVPEEKPPGKGDPRYQSTVDALCVAFEAVKREKYVFKSRDGKAVREHLKADKVATPEEAARRFALALSLTRWPGCTTIPHLFDRWNELAGPSPPNGCRVIEPAAPHSAFGEVTHEVKL